MRDRAWRRQQDRRVVARRRFIIDNVWQTPWHPPAGRLRKHNLTCDCRMHRFINQEEREFRHWKDDQRHPYDGD